MCTSIVFVLLGALDPDLLVTVGLFAVVLLSSPVFDAVFAFVSELSKLWSVVTVEAVAFPVDIAVRTALDCACGVLIMTVSLTEALGITHPCRAMYASMQVCPVAYHHEV